jgi:hypothetical protein
MDTTAQSGIIREPFHERVHHAKSTEQFSFISVNLRTNHEPSFSHVTGFTQLGNHIQWEKAFERSFANFLPLLSLGTDIKIGIVDYIIKIVGGVLTFGLIAIALRRKFERKYTR